MNTDDNAITPGEAIWLLNCIPLTPPNGVMPTAWHNHRKRITAKLQRIVDTAAKETDYYRFLNYTKGINDDNRASDP